MSDEYMILTIERMQIELKRALEDIQLLTEELQRRGPVVPVQQATTELPAVVDAAPVVSEAPKKKRIFKVKKTVSPEPISTSDTEKLKKHTAIQAWNAFMTMIRTEMQGASQEKPKREDVLATAKASKDSDPEAYKVFSINWLASQESSFPN